MPDKDNESGQSQEQTQTQQQSDIQADTSLEQIIERGLNPKTIETKRK